MEYVVFEKWYITWRDSSLCSRRRLAFLPSARLHSNRLRGGCSIRYLPYGTLAWFKNIIIYQEFLSGIPSSVCPPLYPLQFKGTMTRRKWKIYEGSGGWGKGILMVSLGSVGIRRSGTDWGRSCSNAWAIWSRDFIFIAELPLSIFLSQYWLDLRACSQFLYCNWTYE